MEFDAKTFIMGLLTGLTFGLGIVDLVDKDLSEIMSGMGSIVAGLGALFTAYIAFMVYKRWQIQHNYNMINNALDSFNDLLIEYEKYAMESFRNCYYGRDSDFEEFFEFEKKVTFVSRKIVALLPEHLLPQWKRFFKDPVIDYEQEVAPILFEAAYSETVNKEDYYWLKAKLNIVFGKAHINVIEMTSVIPTVFK
ncbi:hypothetical protein ACYTPF_16110 [Alteromonas sp. HB246098]